MSTKIEKMHSLPLIIYKCFEHMFFSMRKKVLKILLEPEIFEELEKFAKEQSLRVATAARMLLVRSLREVNKNAHSL